MNENTTHYEGKGCSCFARSQGDCSCVLADWALAEVYKLRGQAEVKDFRIAELEKERDEVLLSAEIELTKEAKAYIALSNQWLSGELSEVPEGSIYNEDVYVENRVKDIKDPLFVNAATRLEAHNLRQQAKALESAYKHIVDNNLFRCARDYIKNESMKLNKQADELEQGE